MYDTTNDPLTMQKMRKLRELQRRRDLAEKYYSREIHRLIGNHYDMSGRAPTMGRQTHHNEKTFTGGRVNPNPYNVS